MKKAGIIGGMGPESTVEYYKGINKLYWEKTGRGEQFPSFVMENVNVFEMLGYCKKADYEGLTSYLLERIYNVHRAGAEFAILAANTPHIVYEELEKVSPLPMISIVEAVCQEVQKQGIHRVGLLGTKFSMQEDFYKKPFREAGIELIVPGPEEIEQVNDLIANELELGILKPETKAYFVELVRKMKEEQNIEGIILGCTELPLIISQEDFTVACFDTMRIHIEKTVDEMLSIIGGADGSVQINLN